MQSYDMAPKPRVSREAYLLLVLLAGAVAVCLASEAVCRNILHYPLRLYTYPMHLEEIRFPDLVAFYPRFTLLHTEAFFTSTATNHFMYPAAGVPIYQFFYAAAPHMVAAYLAFSLGVLFSGGAMVARSLVRRGMGKVASASYVATTLVCCYPVWFALLQANIEVVVWVLLTAGFALYWKERGYVAVVCFGLAAAIKIYPALFLLLPLYRRRWGQTMVGAAVAVAYSVGSIWYVGPTFSAASQGIGQGLNLFRERVMLQLLDVTGLDHSLFALYKVLLRHHAHSELFAHSLPVYLGLMTFTTVALLLFRLKDLPLGNQLAFCTVVCVLFPPTSFEYTLLQILTLYAFLLLLLMDAKRSGRHIPGLLPALELCAVCLSFLPELIFHGYQFEGSIKAIALLALLFVVIRYPFPSIFQDHVLSPKLDRL